MMYVLASRELLEHPAVAAGKKVLEIGSGCGLCGIVAAKLGAKQVSSLHQSDQPCWICVHGAVG